MIKLQTLGMLNVAKSDPTVIAHADIKNGYFHTISAGKTYAPVAGDSSADQTAEIRIVLQTITGDDRYDPDAVIASGDRVNSFLLKQWHSQNLIINLSDIDLGTGVNYASVTSDGTTYLVANASGNLDIVADPSYYGVYLKVIDKIQFNGDSVLAQVVVA
jgi:hypothetical protein